MSSQSVRFFRLHQQPEAHTWIELEHLFATQKVHIGQRGTMRCADAEHVSFTQKEIAKFSVADLHCFFQHCLEYWLQLAGRA